MQEATVVDHQNALIQGVAPDSVKQWFSWWTMTVVTLLMDLHLGLTMEMELLSVAELVSCVYWMCVNLLCNYAVFPRD